MHENIDLRIKLASHAGSSPLVYSIKIIRKDSQGEVERRATVEDHAAIIRALILFAGAIIT